MTPKRGEGAAAREKIEATRDEMIERAEGLRMAPNPLNPSPPSKALLEMTAMNNKSVDSVIRGIKQLAEAALELSTAKTVREMADVEKLVSAIRGKRLGGMSPDEYDSWFNTGLEGAIEAIAQTVGIDYWLIAQVPERGRKS